ncbi:MAG: type II secretion system protein N [Pseudomonadota bacterium]
MGLSELGAKLVEPTRWIIIGGIAFTLANTVLFFLAPPAGDGQQTGPQPAIKAPDRRPAVSINAILSRNLFGQADASGADVDNGLPAVETRLPLELLGVFVAEEPEASAAIVAQKGKGGETYLIGATLPGNAKLIEVHPEHIVLRRAGARETLRFPQVASNQLLADPPSAPSPTPSAGRSPPPTSAAPAETPRDLVTNYRDRSENDPEGTLKDIGITPVADGSAQGYRLDDSATRSPYLSQTGLQPGDVVLSVNGQPVGNIQQDRRQLDNILAQGSARIEVQRGTRRFFVTASLKQ